MNAVFTQRCCSLGGCTANEKRGERMGSQSLYLECCSGIRGEMAAAALLDLGADLGELKRMLYTLPLREFQVEIGRESSCGVMGCRFQVSVKEGGCGRLNYAEIRTIIGQMRATAGVRELAAKVYQILEEEETKRMGTLAEGLTLGEAGTVESLVSVLSTVFCLESLNVKEVTITSLWEGQGFTEGQSGLLPLPVPSVLNILQSCGLPLHQIRYFGADAVNRSLINPTGAAIAAAIRTRTQLPEQWEVLKTGVGIGGINLPHADILRAMMIRDTASEKELWMLETNIDDSTGEALGYTVSILMEEGARDAFFTPVFMKKGRPAYTLSVLTTGERMARMEELIFLHTSTIGIRKYPVSRTVLKREVYTIGTSLGPAEVKYIDRLGTICPMPEYESVNRLCRESGLGFLAVYDQVKKEAARAWKRKEKV